MSMDFKGIVNTVRENVDKIIHNDKSHSNCSIDSMDNTNETFDFSNYENTTTIDPVKLTIEEIDSGISREKYEKYVNYNSNRLEDEINKNNIDIKKYQENYDEVIQIGLEVQEIDNYKKEYIQNYQGEVIDAIDRLKNLNTTDRQNLLQKYGWKESDLSKSQDELVKQAMRTSSYIHSINGYDSRINSILNRYELTKGMSYDDYKNVKSETQFCIEYINTLKKNNKSEKEMLEYKSLTLLKDFKDQEKNLLTPIETNNVEFTSNSVLGVGLKNKKNNETLQLLNEMEDNTYLKIYNYLKKTNPSKLDDYLNSIKDVTNQYAGMKAANERISKLDKLSDEEISNNIINYLQASGYGFGDGVYDFGEGFAKIFKDGEMTAQDYETMIYLQYLQEHGTHQAGVYTTFQSVGNMTPVIAGSILLTSMCPELGVELSSFSSIGISNVTGSSIIAGLAIGGSSYGNTKNELLYEGYDRDKAILYAALSSSSDAVLEVLLGGIQGVGANSALNGEKNTFKEFAIDYLKSMGQEGREEIIQNFVSKGFESSILGKEYTMGEITEESVKTFIQSAIVSGILNGGTTTTQLTVNGVQYALSSDQIQSIGKDIESGKSARQSLKYQLDLQFFASNENNTNNYVNENGLLDSKLLPLSDNEEQKSYQQKLINGEKISILEQSKFRNDNAKTTIDNYDLKSDHMYRATSYDALVDYVNNGVIKDNGQGKGYSAVNWYLGGAAPKYGKVIIEVPANTNDFELSDHYGGVMSGNPSVRQAHSSNENPVNILFLDSTGQKILKTVNPKSKNINDEIKEGNLLYQIDFLNRKKQTLGDNFLDADQQLLDNLNLDLENLNNKTISNNTFNNVDEIKSSFYEYNQLKLSEENSFGPYTYHDYGDSIKRKILNYGNEDEIKSLIKNDKLLANFLLPELKSNFTSEELSKMASYAVEGLDGYEILNKLNLFELTNINNKDYIFSKMNEDLNANGWKGITENDIQTYILFAQKNGLNIQIPGYLLSDYNKQTGKNYNNSLNLIRKRRDSVESSFYEMNNTQDSFYAGLYRDNRQLLRESVFDYINQEEIRSEIKKDVSLARMLMPDNYEIKTSSNDILNKQWSYALEGLTASDVYSNIDLLTNLDEKNSKKVYSILQNTKYYDFLNESGKLQIIKENARIED